MSRGERKPVEIRWRLCESLECEYDPRSGLIGHVFQPNLSTEEKDGATVESFLYENVNISDRKICRVYQQGLILDNTL